MPTDVLMPKMGYDMTEGRILRWIKSEGDTVRRGEPIAEIETDKVNIEIEAFAEGTLGSIVAPEGEMVAVGAKIATILGEGEPAASVAPATTAQSSAPPPAQAPERQDISPTQQPAGPSAPGTSGTGEGGEAAPVSRHEATAPKPEGRDTAAPTMPSTAAAGAPDTGERLKVSPLARRLAREQGIDLRQVRGSGPAGRIVREDIEAYSRQRPAQAAAPAAEPPPPAPARQAAPAAADEAQRQPLTRMRSAIARRMVESKTTIPHFYVSVEIDMTEALRWRKELNDAVGGEYRITVNDMVVKACALALTKFPNLNASFGGDHIALHPGIDISVAVALPEGLIAVVVRDADQKSLGRIARETADLVGRAREGKLQPDEFSGGTFTVSNLGPFDVETFIAIITPPQAAALAVGSAQRKAVVVDGEIVARDRMNATISADHRVTDGAEAARFVGEVRRLLEHPLALLA